MKLKYSLLFAITFTISNLMSAYAEIRYVSHEGTSTPPYTTWATAADSIQKCIDISEFGDTIYVANGVYKEQVVMIPGLALIGAGMDSCVIDTRDLVDSQNFRSVEVLDSCLFNGFHITVYHNSEWGYGISASGRSKVIHNRITYGRYGIGNGSNAYIYNNILENVSQGVRLFNSKALIRRNFIYIDENSPAVIITGISIQAFDNSYKLRIDSNYIETHRIGIRKTFGSTPIIINNTIKLNGPGGIGMDIGDSDSTKVYNNVIIADEGHSGIYNFSIIYPEIINNYIFGNINGQALFIGPNDIVKNNIISNGANQGVYAVGTENLEFKYNNSWNNGTNYSGFSPDTTNLSVDPMIVNDDTLNGELDFHLQKYSPLIDAGDPEILDRDGSRSDIGLYGGPYGWSYTYQDLVPRPPVNLTAIASTGKIILSWNKNTEADTAYYNVYRDTTSGFTIDSTRLIASTVNNLYTDRNFPEANNIVYKITAIDEQGNESGPSEETIINTVSVNPEEPITINNYRLYQNYPNPLNPTTRIGYRLKEGGYVKLYVYDVKGEQITILVNKYQEGGYYEVEFNTEKTAKGELSSGVYIYQLMVSSSRRIPVFSDIKKMILLR